MGMKDQLAKEAGTRMLPHFAAGYVRTMLDKAIDGIGPLKPVVETAGAKLAAHGGDVEKAVAALVRSHTSLAGLQGFVTNLGGVAIAPATIPANVVGVTLVQCHLVAGIAHLRGYDLEDPRVRNAVLAVMLGKDTVKAMIKSKKLPSSPMALATAPLYDPVLDERIAKEVTGELVGRTIGRRALMLAAKKVPLVGGAVGAGADGFGTYQVGRYAQSELKDRRLRKR